MSAWLSVIGIGEDGLAGLGASAREAIEKADVLVGGTRHLSKVPPGAAERIAWGADLERTIESLARHEGRRVVVLATGDPLHYGVGVTLINRFGAGAVAVLPAPSAFSLAAARMGWALADTTCISVHGRPLAAVNLHVQPNARVLILSHDGATPAAVAKLLAARGFGGSAMTVLSHMGGSKEERLDGTAGSWHHARTADLNTITVKCIAGPDARAWPRLAGLPEEAFIHDGQITKREVRAATLAALAPLAGDVLWDVGAGSGAVAIEWLRAEPSAESVAIERRPDRAHAIHLNAEALGVPRLRVVMGDAPAAFSDLAPSPTAVFVGGGITEDGLLDACWKAIAPGGRMVANGVTLEAGARLTAWRALHGGDLVRISIARAEPLGALTALRPQLDVLQYSGRKVDR
ncbi:MAG: precorrin-6y C5,15-methyltransferase (decarboxylating) subunit CbiE [Rhodospirillales bacterium]|nr:precorrin-6y C5,15-methyltransferase (decarboxylating) subunit CbiE [Rhodospirillales bacterium]